ncbi:hypothetical protein NSK_005864 [Nannochloropsis salina CCMP1776]|uniref:Uncharacterized protein n=1 Tax=Nannochloropsis salina CCMP1776 TaxID=1027361 RepID=A0A4D9CXF2_9STRA|nr:hypothetical protein NSK_005864 [Nannochloropsis salina CCMP1776]|eukprot:TFJ82857.1 hypothetical protein NSK_005864 [Nannochloropsis salina CCMP1776]
MEWSLLLLLLTGLRSSTSFLLVSLPRNPITASVTPIPSWLMPPGPYRHRPSPLWMGGKWVRDPSITQGIVDMVKSFQEKRHAQTENAGRYLQDGLEGIKAHDPAVALTAFEQAAALDNETSLVWHHGAMLYYNQKYPEALEQLDRAIDRYETLYEQVATEERVWRAAVLSRYHGRETGLAKIRSSPPSPYGTETRRLMGAVLGLFEGRVEEEEVLAMVEEARVRREGGKGQEGDEGGREGGREGGDSNPYGNYDLYGFFYIGLYRDACGLAGPARAAMEQATRAPRARQDDVMYHFPRLHLLWRT